MTATSKTHKKEKCCRKLLKKLKFEFVEMCRKFGITICKKKFKTMRGKAFIEDKKIKLPSIQNLESLYIALHEVGHIKLGHGLNSTKQKSIKEYEAENFALLFFRRHNIHNLYQHTYKKISDRAILYILFFVQKEKNSNIVKDLTEIDSSIKVFCKLNKDLYHIL